jgi:hypothetical protein
MFFRHFSAWVETMDVGVPSSGRANAVAETGCATASTSLLTVLAFASTPASWDSKASSQSGSTGHTLPATVGFGSNPNA